LKRRSSEEGATASAIQDSLKTQLDSCQRQLNDLLGMRLRGLLNDEEYLAQKNRLTEEAQHLEGKLRDCEQKPSAWLELAENTLIFAHRAKIWFERGNLFQKRLILETVGLYLSLQEGVK